MLEEWIINSRKFDPYRVNLFLAERITGQIQSDRTWVQVLIRLV